MRHLPVKYAGHIPRYTLPCIVRDPFLYSARALPAGGVLSHLIKDELSLDCVGYSLRRGGTPPEPKSLPTTGNCGLAKVLYLLVTVPLHKLSELPHRNLFLLQEKLTDGFPVCNAAALVST